jgi:hypothetical protein
VALVRTDVSEEHVASFFGVENISQLELANSSILMMEAIRSSETLVIRRATRRRTPEDSILHGHRRENFKYYHVQNS